VNTMVNKGIMCQSTMGQDMPFGPKQTAGISGHCSKAQSGSMQKSVEVSEVSGKQWKTVESQKSCGSEWKTRKGPEEVKKAVGEGRRGRKTWESNSTLHSIRESTSPKIEPGHLILQVVG